LRIYGEQGKSIRMIIYLQHLEGSKKGQVESFDSDRIRIGRLPENELRFDPEAERAVSSRHAEIVRQGETFAIRDLGSRNGTFVNRRRIDAPTPLADGDIIQFASDGPKITFCLQDPSAVTTPKAKAPPEGAAAPPPKRKERGFSGARRFLLPGAAALLAIAVLAFAAWWSWPAFFVVLLALVVLGAGLGAWWAIRRRGRTSPRAEPAGGIAPFGPGRPGDPENLKELRRKWDEGLATLRTSKFQAQGEDPLYAVPWFLALGETGSGKTETIRAANPLSWLSSSGKRPGVGGTRNCDWWFFDRAVFLDTAGRYASPGADRTDGSEWREVLSLLKKSRPLEPINGTLVVVAANALAGRSVKRLQEEASALRGRLDDMLRHLGATFPVYLVVTKLDLISGFTEFFGGLPDAVRGQAMGYANEDPYNRSGATAFFDRAFRTLADRLDRLRLSRMDEEERAGMLRVLYLFPEEFRGLRAPLRAFVEALFRPNPYHETPAFRGLYFTSAKQEGAPLSCLGQALGFEGQIWEPVLPVGPLFTRDVFSTILSQDRSVVGRSAASQQKIQRARTTALAATVALSGVLAVLLTVSLIRNARALSRLDLDPCLTDPPGSGGAVLAARIQALDACRETIDGLVPHSFWGRLASNFGLNQVGKIEGPLRERYLQTFRSAVLVPLEARIDEKLARPPEAPAYVSALVQQIKWLGQCRASGGCPPQDKALLTAYRVMLGAEYPGLRDGDSRVEQLARTHETYIRWQPGAQALERLQGEYTKRLTAWLQPDRLRPEVILAAAPPGVRPVSFASYWGEGVDTAAKVDPRYTRQAWLEGIQPLLAGLRVMAPDQREVAESIARFEADYRAEVFRQWGQFLASFPQGERLAAGGRRPGRELAVWLLGPDSAYRRVIDTAAINLAPFMGGPQKEDIPAWALTLQRYADLKAKAAEGQKGGKPGGEDRKAKAGGPDQEAMGYLTGYWDALEQLRAELSTPERAFRAAKKALDEGESSETSAFAFQKAGWNLERLKGSIGAPQRDDQFLWALVDRPYRAAWRAILDQAGVYLQQQWETVRPGLLDPQGSPTSKARDLMGFVNGPAAPFLEPGSYTPKTLLQGERLSFTGGFLGYLARARRPSDEFGRIEPPLRIIDWP
jgi:type VI secretion system protein ImpL